MSDVALVIRGWFLEEDSAVSHQQAALFRSGTEHFSPGGFRGPHSVQPPHSVASLIQAQNPIGQQAGQPV